MKVTSLLAVPLLLSGFLTANIWAGEVGEFEEEASLTPSRTDLEVESTESDFTIEAFPTRPGGRGGRPGSVLRPGSGRPGDGHPGSVVVRPGGGGHPGSVVVRPGGGFPGSVVVRPGSGGWSRGGGRVFRPYPITRGYRPWRHWYHPRFVRPVYRFDWGRVRLITCTSQDSYGNQYPVTQNEYTGFGFLDRIEEIQDDSLDRCYAESGGDTGCTLVGCYPVYY